MISMHTSPIADPGAGDAGGMNVVEWHQAIALAELGHEVEFVTRRSDPLSPDLVEVAPGVTLRQVTAGPAEPLAKSRISDHIEEFADGLQAIGPIDVVHSQHWMSGVAGLPFARSRDVAHVQSFHSIAAPGAVGAIDWSAGEQPESDGRIAGEALTASESDLVVAISRYEAEVVVERCGADPCRVVVVAPGVDSEQFRPLAAGEQPWSVGGAGQGQVLFAGRLQPLKGPDLAIEAVAGLRREVRPHLVLAGDVSADFASYRGELEALVAARGVQDFVTFAGPLGRAELAHAMRSSRALLMPSYSETYGLVLLEAAASGVPVLAWRGSGMREAVVDQATGLLVADRSPQAWSAALARVLSEAEGPAMGVAARARALDLSWQRSAGLLEDAYRRVSCTAAA